MRVCLLGRYFDLRGGGLGRVSMEVMYGLVKKGHSIKVISTKGNSLSSYLFYTSTQVPLKMPRQGFDIYHALTPMEAIWIPKGRGVVTFHDLFQFTHPDKVGAGISGNGLRNFIGKEYFINIISKVPI